MHKVGHGILRGVEARGEVNEINGSFGTMQLLHQRGQGALVGPDLTNSPERDPLALRQDIVDPNASLNPDHIGYELTLRDGRTVVGVIASDRPGRFLLRQPGGATITVEHDQIVTQRQLTQSLMPEGLGALGEDKLRDLITYLTTPAGR